MYYVVDIYEYVWRPSLFPTSAIFYVKKIQLYVLNNINTAREYGGIIGRQRSFNTNNNVDKHQECFYEDVV